MLNLSRWQTGSCLVLAGAFALAVPMIEASAQQARIKSRAQVAIDISANVLELDEKKKKATFTGKVDAIRGRVKLKADKLVIDYAEVKRKNGSKKSEIQFLTATGNVTIITGNQTIRSRRARMDVRANRAVITGNVRVVQGKIKLKGQKLKLNLTTGESRMEGRVGGVFGQ